MIASRRAALLSYSENPERGSNALRQPRLAGDAGPRLSQKPFENRYWRAMRRSLVDSLDSCAALPTDGRLLMLNVAPADISDSAGAQAILAAIRKRWPFVKHLFADGAYDRARLLDTAAFLEFVIEVVRRIDAEPGRRSSSSGVARAHLSR